MSSFSNIDPPNDALPRLPANSQDLVPWSSNETARLRIALHLGLFNKLEALSAAYPPPPFCTTYLDPGNAK